MVGWLVLLGSNGDVCFRVFNEGSIKFHNIYIYIYINGTVEREADDRHDIFNACPRLPGRCEIMDMSHTLNISKNTVSLSLANCDHNKVAIPSSKRAFCSKLRLLGSNEKTPVKGQCWDGI